MSPSSRDPLQPDDPTWMPRLRRGDVSAMEEIYDAYAEAMVAFAVTIVRRADVAEDLAQDVLLTLWARREDIEIHTSLRQYLFIAIRNAAFNHQRGERRTAERDVLRAADEPDESIGLPQSSTPVDVRLEDEDRVRHVRRAIEGLPPKYRQVLVLRASGFDYDAIAGLLEVPVKTIRTQVGRGVELLQQKLLRKF